jgi:hypothetical protein
MKKIGIIYSDLNDKLTEFLLQSIMFYPTTNISFDILTNNVQVFEEYCDFKNWNKQIYHTIECKFIDNVQFEDYIGIICISSQDFYLLKNKLSLDSTSKHYITNNIQALSIKNYNNSIKQINLLFERYKKHNKQIENITFLTAQENINEIENRIIQDITDFGYKLNIMSFTSYFELPIDPATLIISASNPCFFPILNMTYGKDLIIEIINPEIIITIANTINYLLNPQKLISNLRKNFNYIIHQQSDIELFANSNIIPYSAFSEFYENYMKHVDYESWADFIVEKYKNINNSEPKQILEISCGTAAVSRILKNRSYEIEACDIVPEMLDIARFLNRDLTLFHADMVNYKLNKNYDLIVSLFDSVNYLLSKESFVSMLNNTYNHLLNNGLYIFDISTFFNSTENFDGYVNVEDNNENFLLHRAEYFSTKKTQETTLNLFSQKFNIFTREDEIHEQKVWFTKEILDMIKETQFNLIGIYDISTNNNLISNKTKDLDNFYCRLFFVLQKNNE